jgi:hypothetical protein
MALALADTHMTATWIAVAVAAAAAAVLIGTLARRRRTAADRERAVIVDLEDSTALDPGTGAVRSVQKADLVIGADALREIWTPAHLERLARTYWRFLARVTLGLVRVSYNQDERSVILLVPALKLVTFQAPEYQMNASRGVVNWRIERGLLVSRRKHNLGYLQIEVCRGPGDDPQHVRLHVEVEVANFYPSIASKLSRRLYNATQSRIHVIVTYGFLRSLVRLDLARSRVGRLGGA